MKALSELGFQFSRQRGSHMVFTKAEKIVPVPRDDELGPGLIGAIAAEIGMSKEDFERLLD